VVEPFTKEFKLIACGVLRGEIEAVRKQIPPNIRITEVWLEQGLHRNPGRLNELITAEIAAAESENRRYDAILIGYGICSKGTVGISSTRYPVVVPRAHDCITLFLGSKERYLDEFSKAPGTYWFTPGFIGGSVQPGMSEKYAGVYQEFEEKYEEYLAKFGNEELAGYVLERREQAWIKNYTRGVYVESGLPGCEALREKARAFCESRGWIFEVMRGDLGLLRDLLAGEWDPGRFLVLEPGERLVMGGVDEIIAARGKDEERRPAGEDYRKRYVFDGEYREVGPGDAVSLNGDIDVVVGIDAGGTFTDAVVVSLLKRKVLAAGKSPTTHHDLSIGVRNALEKLPEDLLRRAARIAISSTLATNSIVEGKGARTGLILIGYDESTSGMVVVGNGDVKAVVRGRHDVYGEETVPFDEEDLLRAAGSMIGRGIEAIAVSSYMATRNPGHEIRAKKILEENFPLPVVAGHELTDDIDSVRRAHTALLNARLLPVIKMLISSIVRVVRELGLTAGIRLVTTEGTLMNPSEALEKPVRLILSGPAASVEGVRFLTDMDSCLLVDMGGTTSDIAMIEGGSARRTGRGSVVGKYRTSIHATDIRTIGLGGDSGISWERGKVKVGPQRLVPISVLAAEHGRVLENLASLKGYDASDYGLVQPGVHFLLVRMPENDSFFGERERAVIELLSHGPLSVVELAERLAYPYLSLLGTHRLEELGLVRRSGLTPTDLMVAGKELNLGDARAASLMLELYSERSGLPVPDFVKAAWNEIHRIVSCAVVTEILAGGDNEKSFPGCDFCESLFSGNAPLEVSYALKHPLVGIGAPSRVMLQGIDAFLSARAVFPEYAEVANAVGAAAGAGGMHLDMTILTDEKGRFYLFSPEGKHIFRDLDAAKEEAVRISKEYALDYAKRVNYERFGLDIHVRDRTAPSAFDGELYIDTTVVARMRY